MRVNHLLSFLFDILKPGRLHFTPTRGTDIVGIELVPYCILPRDSVMNSL